MGGGEKHVIYVVAFGSYLFYDGPYFLDVVQYTGKMANIQSNSTLFICPESVSGFSFELSSFELKIKYNRSHID